MLNNLPHLLTQNYITRGFWGDEAWTAVISRLPIPEIIQVTGQDFHPPLYYLFVHVFIRLFGSSEWIRLISTLFFALSLVAVYHLTKKLMTQAAAVVSTILVAVSPILFVYTFEARSYAMLTMMSVVSTYVFWQAVNLPGNRKKSTKKTIRFLVIYAILGVLGVYTHYYMWFILASHGVYWLLLDRRQFKAVFLSYLFMVVVQAPWIPVLFSQVNSVAGDYWIGAPNERTHAEYLMRVMAGDVDTPWQVPLSRVMFAAVLVSPILVWFKNKRRVSKPYWLMWCWWLVPVLIPTLISLVMPVFFYRYLVFTSVPIIIIVVWGWSALGKKALYVLAVLLLVFYVRTDYRIAARFPRSMREEVAVAFATSTPPSGEVQIYTYLPAFAEVYHYAGDLVPVKVRPIGLVHFSGRSLLYHLRDKGRVEIVEPGEGEAYWEFEPGPESKFIPSPPHTN